MKRNLTQLFSAATLYSRMKFWSRDEYISRIMLGIVPRHGLPHKRGEDSGFLLARSVLIDGA